MSQASRIKVSFDHKGPHAFLAKDRVYRSIQDILVAVNWRPTMLDADSAPGTASVARRQHGDAAGEAEGFGVPTFMFGNEMLWGCEHLAAIRPGRSGSAA